jgi:NAD(P)-dependent dehydrogenase (short-subunit alcohol dehydrogenase family)
MSAVLVTGTASGIGAAIAAGLVAAGTDVACLDLAPHEVASGPGRAHVVRVDVSDPAAVDTAVGEAWDALGPLAGCVTCAAIEEPRAVAHALDPDVARRVLEVNVLGTLYTAQAVVRRLVAAGLPGSIVLFGSMLSTVAMPGLSLYGSSKGAVAQLGRGLAVDWAPHGIRVNTIAPGVVNTPMSAVSLADPVRSAAIRESTPMGRPAEVQEIADVVGYLLGPTSSYVTGALISVDGGWTAQA